jgi:hypothetical protein
MNGPSKKGYVFIEKKNRIISRHPQPKVDVGGFTAINGRLLKYFSMKYGDKYVLLYSTVAET